LVRLTEPQREVLDLLAAGLSNQKIAQRLGLSLRAIEDRKARLILALEADSLAELLAISMLAKEPLTYNEPRPW
jgi:DNA-binding NarL/FixJ family response regulator